MAMPSVATIRNLLNVRRTMPLLTLELRNGGRQKRTYAIRLAYVGLLSMYALLVWSSITMVRPGQADAIAHMARIGQTIVADLLQFCAVAGPLAAVLLTANALNEELHPGRLAVLWSSPVTAGNIVLGKFLGRISHVLVLLLAAGPVLATARVFGGVSWLAAGGGLLLCVSLAILAGAITMLCCLGRHLATGLILSLAIVTPLCLYHCYAMGHLVRTINPGQALPLVFIGAGAELVLAVVLLGAVVHRFRRVIPYVFGDDNRVKAPRGQSTYVYMPAIPGVTQARVAVPTGAIVDDDRGIADIHGSPVLWRAMRRQFLSLKNLLLLTALLGAYFYIFVATLRGFGSGAFHAGVLSVLLVVAALTTVVYAATAISSDKQRGTWQLLLVTPMGDEQIFKDKIKAIALRLTPIAALLAAHLLLFTAMGMIAPLAALESGLAIVGGLALALGLGLYCSARFGRNTLAMALTAGILAGLWLVGPLLAGLLGVTLASQLGQDHWAFNYAAAASRFGPVVQLPEILSGPAGSTALYGSRDAQWMRFDLWLSVLESSLVGLGAGIWLLKRAVATARQHCI